MSTGGLEFKKALLGTDSRSIDSLYDGLTVHACPGPGLLPLCMQQGVEQDIWQAINMGESGSFEKYKHLVNCSECIEWMHA